MAPNIARGRSEPSQGLGSEYRAQEVVEKILEAVDDLREEIEENCDYVGDEFAEEAKRIHFGESEEHGIYGEATEEEADELDYEGVEYFRFPTPRRRND
mgnify:FL=1